MRIKLVLSVFALTLIFMGCTTESVESIAEETTESQLTSNNNQRPFKVRSSGTFNVVAPDVCAPLAQIILEGTGNGTHLGRFDVIITWCDDFEGTTIQNGIVTAANGDELYFYASGFGTDDDGDFWEYIFEDGTGRFDESSGYLKLYNTVEFTGPEGGVYSNAGEGFIVY